MAAEHQKEAVERDSARQKDEEQNPSPPDLPPPQAATLPAVKTFHPFSPAVVCILAPSSIFGALARLGLKGLATYNGQSIFPLAWVQGIGCLVMGFAVGLRGPITQLYVCASHFLFGMFNTTHLIVPHRCTLRLPLVGSVHENSYLVHQSNEVIISTRFLRIVNHILVLELGCIFGILKWSWIPQSLALRRNIHPAFVPLRVPP